MVRRLVMFFLKLLPRREMCFVDSIGFSGGLLSVWNPVIVNLFPFMSSTGILLEGFVVGWD